MLEGAIGFEPTLTADTGFLACAKKDSKCRHWNEDTYAVISTTGCMHWKEDRYLFISAMNSDHSRDG